MLGNQSLSGLDINKHPSNCLIFFLMPPSQLAPTNKATTIRLEQWYHLKKPRGGWIDSPPLAVRARRKHCCLGALFVLGRSSLIWFFPFSFQHLSVLPPGRGARCCWWWYNNTVRNLPPIPRHLVFSVNQHPFFSSPLLHSPFHRSIFRLFSFTQITFSVASQTPQLLMLYGHWWKLFFYINAQWHQHSLLELLGLSQL